MTAHAPLANWSPWLPFAEAVLQAPRSPGVYLARTADHVIVYVGKAGERRGNGIRGRLSVYAKGKAAVSGLGEAVFNRALADPSFVRARLAEVEAGSPRSAQEWSRAAFAHTGLELCWSPTDDGVAALALEHQVIAALDGQGLWNVRIAKPPGSRATRKGNSID